MNRDDLDRILAQEKEILPSSGFAASVMEAVRGEAAAPPPLPFPWKRALPGVVVSCLVLLWVFIEAVLQVIRGGATLPLPPSFGLTLASVLQSPKTAAVCWMILALLLSFASVKLAMFLARRTTV
jgi:hypothetical protein